MSGVIVKVPATSANLGSGYDCLGIALDLWNELKVTESNEFSITVKGEGSNHVDLSEENLIVKSTKLTFKHLGKDFPSLKFECQNNIPLARGLGSSAAATISGILAGWILANKSVPDLRSVYKLAAQIDGHPDNAAPAIYGGVCISYTTQPLDSESDDFGASKFDFLFHSKINLPIRPFRCVIFVPNQELKTSESRSAVPSQVSIYNTIFNISRTALLVNSLSSGDMSLLKHGMQDTLHQPYRSKHIKHLNGCINAAMENGAWGAHLSGSGPSVIAWSPNTQNDEKLNEKIVEQIKDAMVSSAQSLGVEGSVLITQIVDSGAKIEFKTNT